MTTTIGATVRIEARVVKLGPKYFTAHLAGASGAPTVEGAGETRAAALASLAREIVWVTHVGASFVRDGLERWWLRTPQVSPDGWIAIRIGDDPRLSGSWHFAAPTWSAAKRVIEEAFAPVAHAAEGSADR